MSSQLHEALLLLFRNRPELAPELLRDAMHMDLPYYTLARIDCADLNEVQPTEYRADLVVLRPSGVPEITEEAQARADPELAVLSAMAHGRDKNTAKSVQIALVAQLASQGLDADRSTLCFDLVLTSLSEAARRELQTMDPAKYQYQSEFARRYFAQGIEQGIAQGIEQGVAQGRAALVLRQLTVRFGPLDEDIQTRIRQASIDELDSIGERLLSAGNVYEAVLPPRNERVHSR